MPRQAAQRIIMHKSLWTFHLDANYQKGAEIVLHQCIKALEHPPIDCSMEPASSGGFRATLSLRHTPGLSWPEALHEVMQHAQRLGVGWVLLGHLDSDPHAILNRDFHSRIKIPGLSWAEWQLAPLGPDVVAAPADTPAGNAS